MVCIIIYVIASNATKRRQRKYEMVEKAIESGVEIPEYVFRETPEKDNAKAGKSTLNSAVILIAVGIAVTLFFTIKENYDVAALSSVILLLGIGKLIVYILDARSEKKLQESKNGGKAEERQDGCWFPGAPCPTTGTHSGGLSKNTNPTSGVFSSILRATLRLATTFRRTLSSKPTPESAASKDSHDSARGSTGSPTTNSTTIHGATKSRSQSSFQNSRKPMPAKIDLAEALKHLNEQERTVVVLYYMEDKPIKDVAAITGMPEGTVKSHISRAKAKLVKFLK